MATKKPAKSRTTVRKSTGKSTEIPVGALIPQPHGGAIRNGGTNAGGPGRPPDEVRAAYRQLGATKGYALVDSVLDGKVRIRFYGMCPSCKKESTLPEGDALDKLIDEVGEAVRASVDQQLKANEQALKYGLGQKDELSVTDHPKFREAVSIIRNELEAEFGADRVDNAILRGMAKLTV